MRKSVPDNLNQHVKLGATTQAGELLVNLCVQVLQSSPAHLTVSVEWGVCVSVSVHACVRACDGACPELYLARVCVCVRLLIEKCLANASATLFLIRFQ